MLFALLLVIIPLQSVWAAATNYCLHEAGAVSHFGHHKHPHHQTKSAPDDKSSPSSANDTDCSSCHQGAAPLLPGEKPLLLLPPPASPNFLYRWAKLTHIPPGPERPDRPLVA